MKLLCTATLQLYTFRSATHIPPYAALSSCWKEGDVFWVDSMSDTSDPSDSDDEKVKTACSVAQGLGYSWLWAHTACVDKSSTEELSEAINSNFRWFQNCQVCIVYLDDVNYVQEDLESQLRGCGWLQRCWTLQELIAPQSVEFYDSQWTPIGNKRLLLSLLSDITKVDVAALESSECLSDFSVGRKMSWAAHRQATLPEDVAYSLLGIFGVNMSIIYGEGPIAFLRLQDEILRATDDATILAWQSSGSPEYRGLFATSPSDFSHFADTSITAPLHIQGHIYLLLLQYLLSDSPHLFTAEEGSTLLSATITP
ncbi:hypothetical protein GQ53DRAFT_852500 [Thozetella sp. PMI_491]|nr:hypothetical protein GQ53DRAFT_852500 [Thozetella sp. PMI_491]